MVFHGLPTMVVLLAVLLLSLVATFEVGCCFWDVGGAGGLCSFLINFFLDCCLPSLITITNQDYND